MTSAIKWEFQQLKGTVQQVNHNNKTKEKNLLRSETEMKMKKKKAKFRIITENVKKINV